MSHNCVTPSGRTDGHGAYVEIVGGAAICTFYKQPIAAQECAYVGGKDAVGDDAPTCHRLATKGRWCDVHAPPPEPPGARPGRETKP